MKKIFSILLSVVSIALLVSCSNSSSTKEISIDDLFLAIKTEIAADLKEGGVDNALVDGELMLYMEADLTDKSEYFSTLTLETMGIETSGFAEGKVLAAMMNTNSDQIIILKANSVDDVPTLKAGLEKVLAAQDQTWSWYLADQYEKVKENKIVVNGLYLLYVTYGIQIKLSKYSRINSSKHKTPKGADSVPFLHH